jgi:hypothetical protein
VFVSGFPECYRCPSIRVTWFISPAGKTLQWDMFWRYPFVQGGFSPPPQPYVGITLRGLRAEAASSSCPWPFGVYPYPTSTNPFRHGAVISRVSGFQDDGFGYAVPIFEQILLPIDGALPTLSLT